MGQTITFQPAVGDDSGNPPRPRGTVWLFQDAIRHDLQSARRSRDPRAGIADLRRAQRNLHELIAALDPRVAPDLTASLASCYQSVFDAVSVALATPCPATMDEALRRLECISSALGSAAALVRLNVTTE